MATLAANTYNLKLAFTTWLCPEWTVAAILDGMQSYKYDGVELILGKGHLHGIELDTGGDYLTEVRKQFDEANLAVACLTTHIELSHSDLLERKKSVEQLKRALLVAETLGAPYISVLGGEVPKHLEITGVVDYVSESLAEAAEQAEQMKSRAVILLENKPSFAHSRYSLEIMRQVFSKKAGVLWNVLQTIRSLETVEGAFDALGDHIRHVHVCDCDYNDDRTQIEAANPGTGMMPLGRVVDLLKAGLFRGYLSVDPLKRDVDADEILPQYAQHLKKLIVAPDEK